ncbi:type II toxin-antitoxin system PemK/MazF family toxin [Bacillus sp. NPDC094106]|uniref:type II toxin-antitoxin system PemK/MazF family toxin n=1 Tax=Bacillus sp. NPDC094106 TaxID=3363949 RepID=UPI0037F95DC4
MNQTMLEATQQVEENTQKTNQVYSTVYYKGEDVENALLHANETDYQIFAGLKEFTPKGMVYTVKERFTQKKPKHGEIWTVDLGVNVGSEMNKIRPCVIVSPDSYNESQKLVVVVPITHADKSLDCHMKINSELLTDRDCSINGIIKAEQIRTVSHGRLHKHKGTLLEKGLNELKLKMRNFYC